MVWRLKQLFRKIFPFLVIGGVAFGGYNLYKANGGRFGRPTLTRMLQKVPYFGPRLSHYIGGSRYAYKPGRGQVARGKRHHGRHGRRRHGRRRRH